MLKKDITYEDWEGNEVTETFYFNLTKTELFELEASYKKGLIATMEEFLRANDKDSVIQAFKKLIKTSYGVKSDDGSNRFIKSEELSLAFTQTPAYDVLFMELATDDKAGGEFIMGILPREFEPEIKKELAMREAKEKAQAAQEERQKQQIQKELNEAAAVATTDAPSEELPQPTEVTNPPTQ